MSDKVTLLMQSLTDFYKHPDNIRKLKPILSQESCISLRVLDWFITNYSKKKSIMIGDNFDIYQNYKLQLRSYSKKQFDPFCRKNKILFYYDDSNFLETSCGQLCFFRWCIQNGILDFVEKHIRDIEEDMKDSVKHTNVEQAHVEKQSPHKKRQTLSVSASRTVSKRNVKYTISFD